MKKIFFAAAIIVLFAGAAFAQESDKGLDPNKLFYAANGLYEKRDYTKALDEYNKILGMGIDSGNLYYNMANTYFKLGKLGYAVLFYEKAKRVMPHDSDLKANLDYARSLTTTSAMEVPRKNPVVTFVKTLFKNFSLNAIALSALMTYLVLMALFAVGIMNPVFAKKARIAYVAIAVIFFMNLGAFAIRYYDEEMLRRGVVVQKDTECKYEPIDKSTTFYKLQEGNEVSVMETREGWRQVRRIDGKTGWVRQEAVEEI